MTRGHRGSLLLRCRTFSCPFFRPVYPGAPQTHCPYKGTASYWSVQTAEGLREDLVWIYRTPLPESQKVAGLACFYDEKVDVYLDGELQPRPRSPFS